MKFYIEDNCLMNGNEFVAESFGSDELEVYDVDLLTEWFEDTYPEEAAYCDQYNISEVAREKLCEIISRKGK